MRQSTSYNNFAQLSKVIENNKIEANLVQFTTKRQIERNRQTYSYPALISKAKLHQQATKFGYRRDLKGQTPQVCPCCMFRVDGERVPFCYGTTSYTIEEQQDYEEFKLPAGVSLFFSLYKTVILFMLIVSILSVVFFRYVLNDIKSKERLCTRFKICHPALTFLKYRSHISDYHTTEEILILVTILFGIIFFFIYRKLQYNLNKTITEKFISEDTYTVLISNIPLIDFPKKTDPKSSSNSEFLYRKHLQNYLQEKIRAWMQGQDRWTDTNGTNEGDVKQMLQKNGGQLKSQQIIKSISLCYNLSRLEILDDTRTILMKQQQNHEDDSNQLIQDPNQSSNDRFSTVPKRVDFINDCSIVLNKQFATDNSFLFNLTHFVGFAFVSFQFQHYKAFFLEEYSKDRHAFSYNGNYLRIDSAAHPNDVYWKNFRIPNEQKNTRKINSYLLIALTLVVLFIIHYLFDSWLYDKFTLFNIKNDQMTIVTIVLLKALFVILGNYILKKICRRLTNYEQHKTKVNSEGSFLVKAVVSQFINSGPFFYITSIMVQSLDLLHITLYAYLIINMLLSILQNLILPESLWKHLKNWIKYRNLTDEDAVNKFQIKLNHEFQNVEFSIVERYIFIIVNVYVSLFFVYHIPFGVCICFIHLAIQFWIDKNNLFNRCSLLYNSNFRLARFALKVLQISLFVFGLGVLIFSCRKAFDLLGFICFLVGLIYALAIILTPAKLQRKIFGRNEASDRFTYDDCVSEGKFAQTYWTQNPATFLVDETNITGKTKVTNPALLRLFATGSNSQ